MKSIVIKNIAMAISLYGVSSQAAILNILEVAAGFNVKVIVECSQEKCNGPAEVRIEQNSGEFAQIIQAPKLTAYFNETGEIPINGTVAYGNQGLVVADDFNFDGAIDLAIRNGNNSGYRGPSYDVYVFDRSKGKLIQDEELTELATTKLGMFTVDKRLKRLITHEKSGCCWHRTTHYAITQCRGLYVAYSKEEAAGGQYVDVTTSTLKGRRFRTKSKRYLVSSYYQ